MLTLISLSLCVNFLAAMNADFVYSKKKDAQRAIFYAICESHWSKFQQQNAEIFATLLPRRRGKTLNRETKSRISNTNETCYSLRIFQHIETPRRRETDSLIMEFWLKTKGAEAQNRKLDDFLICGFQSSVKAKRRPSNNWARSHIEANPNLTS